MTFEQLVDYMNRLIETYGPDSAVKQELKAKIPSGLDDHVPERVKAILAGIDPYLRGEVIETDRRLIKQIALEFI